MIALSAHTCKVLLEGRSIVLLWSADQANCSLRILALLGHACSSALVLLKEAILCHSFAGHGTESLMLPQQVLCSVFPSAGSGGDNDNPVPVCRAQKAVIVGAGPAGSCAAMYLARKGFLVEVYEKRFQPKADQV